MNLKINENNPNIILKIFQKSEVIRNLLLITDKKHAIKINNLKGYAFSLLVILFALEKERNSILIFTDQEKADKTNLELNSLIKILKLENKIEILNFPDYNLWEKNSIESFKETRYERISVINKIYVDNNIISKNSNDVKKIKIITTTLSSSLRFITTKSNYINHSIIIHQKDEINFASILKKLLSIGYEKSPIVRQEGELAIRGGIIDIFPFCYDSPIRIEFFGNKIEEIRVFSISDQKSKTKTDSILITPTYEIIYDSFFYENNKKSFFPEHTAFLKNSEYFEEIIIYSHLFSQKNSMLEFAKKEGYFIFISEKNECLKKFENKIKKEKKALQNDISFDSEKKNIQSQNLTFETSNLAELQYENRIKYLINEAIEISENDFESKEQNPSTLNFRLPIEYLPPHFGHLETFINSLSKKEGTKIIISKHAAALKRILSEEINDTLIFEGALENGFFLKDIPSYFFTDGEIAPSSLSILTKKKTGKDKLPIKTIQDIKKGDYVVHINHGIGIYDGLQKREIIKGLEKEYLSIKYAGGDYLYVPIDQMDRIEKYIAPEGIKPHINRLGSPTWNRLKQKVRQGIEIYAYELFKLYKDRLSVEGYSFSPDSILQKEMENSFEYEETEDQKKVIEEIKKDMESNKVVDRIVYGDVGFGKTEIAIRAAFKAKMDNKQTALICPTTILASQHYETFFQRLKHFNIKVETLSRFKSKKEQKETINRLKNGDIDIIIGTHRLLSKDVFFKDLGLLIIDEEQRFGVRHKEKLKMLKRNVDCITLTATPIPRTLHMSLIGLKDISRIETPPPGRLSIKTFVQERRDEDIIKAIDFEIERGGQVYYIHNKINTLENEYKFLKTAFPNVKIAMAHGRMPENTLEETIFKFLRKEFQILLCTTIIENGIDISSVNTIIVDNCENFGLSDLYQLRGRVGRSNIQAYAYFFYSPYKILTEDAKKRLSAIKDFSTLGSGYELAMKDLQIRGAGNLLGKQQHGFISNVGLSLYCNLMANSISKFKGEYTPEENQVQIDLDLPTYIPDFYIKDEDEKITTYKRITSAISDDELENIKLELIDRFGQLPEPVENIFTLCKIKNLAELIGIEKIISSTGEIEIFPPINVHNKRFLKIKKLNNCIKIQSNWATKNDKIRFLIEMLQEKLAFTDETKKQ